MTDEHPHANLGYRVLTEDEQAAVAKIRVIGATLEALVAELKRDGDLRWVAIATTHFQEGLMASVRSVTKPDFF